MKKDEHILVSDLKDGEEEAFRYLVDQYQDKVYNTCISFVKNPDDADDLTQEVFLEVYNSIHKFRLESKLSTWIYRISVNKSLEYLRKMKRKKRFGFLFAIDFERNQRDNVELEFNHPGILAENKEKAAILYRAIEKLPENQRIAFTLHKLEDLSYDQISEIMNKSLSSVESIMHRAKLNLRKELFNYYKSL
jgi:RNA polymerase sigma-70 factor (ECF subfamily)